jgi:hypothetical protein
MKGSNWRLPLYPRLHLLPSGEIFYAGSFNTHYVYPFIVTAFPSATFNINTLLCKKHFFERKSYISEERSNDYC